MKNKIAIYPGSFDPVTIGHIDIIERASLLFDEVTVAIGINGAKHPLFTNEEKVELLQKSLAHLPNIRVVTFSGLLADYLQRTGIHYVVRGLRSTVDFEYEFQMAHLNHRLNKNIETVFLMAAEEHGCVSSSVVREIAAFGGSVEGLVPPPVEQALKQKFHS